MTEIRRLLTLAQAPSANCDAVDSMLDEHISRVCQQRRDLAKLERELKALRVACHPSRQARGCGILRETVAAGPVKGPTAHT